MYNICILLGWVVYWQKRRYVASVNYIRTTCPCLHLDLTFKVVVFKLWLAESELTKHLIQAKLLTAATVTYKGWTAQKQPERQHNNQQRGRSRVRDAESTQKDRQSTRVSSYVEFNYRTDYTVLKILEIYDCVTRNTSLISSESHPDSDIFDTHIWQRGALFMNKV